MKHLGLASSTDSPGPPTQGKWQPLQDPPHSGCPATQPGNPAAALPGLEAASRVPAPAFDAVPADVITESQD